LVVKALGSSTLNSASSKRQYFLLTERPIYANCLGVKHSLLKNTITKLFRQGHSRNLRTLLEKIHPADLALILPNIDAENKKALFEHYVTDKQTARIISKLRDKKTIFEVLSNLKRQRISEIFKHVEPDDAAYLLGTLPSKEGEALLRLMKKDDAEEVNKVLKFSKRTSAGIMNPFFVSVRIDSSIDQCIRELRKSKDKNGPHYIYVTDADGVIKGEISGRDLLKYPLETKVAEIMDDNPIYLSWNAPHTEIVDVSHRYGLPEIPIVNRSKRIIGVVSPEHIFKTARQESASIILNTSGLIDLREASKTNTLNSVKIKLPIILLATVIGFLGANAVNYYLDNAGPHSVIISLLPLTLLVSYVLSSSSSSILLRELFFERISSADISSVRNVMTELKSGFFYGIVISASTMLYALSVLTKNTKIAAVCSIGIFLSCLSSSLIAPFLGVLLARAGVKPTKVPLPLIIAMTIMVSLVLYLWAANYLYYTNVIPSWKTLRF